MSVRTADGGQEAPAVVDLLPAGAPGLILIDTLQLLERLLALDPAARVVVLSARPEVAAAAPGRARRYLTDAAHAARLGLAVPAAGSTGAAGSSESPAATATAAPTGAIADVEAAHIHRMLTLHRGNKTAAARALGIHVTTLRRKLARSGH